jgi:guanylate kinase
MLFVISGASGAGKTTIIKELLRKMPELSFSVSATTRPRRNDEIGKRDYYFLGKEEFLEKIGNQEFVEWEEVHGNYYGTLKSEIEKSNQIGTDIVFDVDVNGALSIKSIYPDAVAIFIDVPRDDLIMRLRERKTDTVEQIKTRIARMDMEMDKKGFFDYVIMNKTEDGGINRALNKIIEIIKHEKTNNDQAN